MPHLQKSSFYAPFYCRNPHIQTIYPSVFRKVKGFEYQRERFELPDGDFLDLDFSKIGSKKLVLVLHGLEGSADRPYVRGMVKLFNANGWDGLGMNFRGCSGEDNRLARTYHSGETEDLNSVIEKLSAEGYYEDITIIGFSLGGNVTLKYIGEQGKKLNPLVQRAVVFSVPVHLQSASEELAKWSNKLYMNRFMCNLKDKVRGKEALVRGKVDLAKVYTSKSFLDFDEYFTAPIFGFDGAVDYWTRSSSKQFLENIQIPALLVNAQDDSFLSAACYPYEAAQANPHLTLETPLNGGHVGFLAVNSAGHLWSEQRALAFVQACY